MFVLVLFLDEKEQLVRSFWIQEMVKHAVIAAVETRVGCVVAIGISPQQSVCKNPGLETLIAAHSGPASYVAGVS